MRFDRDTVEEVVIELGGRAQGRAVASPHPMETDTYLNEHLDAIGSHLIIDAPASEAASDRPLKDKVIDRAKGRSDAQTSFNSRVVHSLHQFDHRTRYQREEIRALRQELAASRELITQLQRRIDRLEPQ